jgi:hypothetical protein
MATLILSPLFSQVMDFVPWTSFNRHRWTNCSPCKDAPNRRKRSLRVNSIQLGSSFAARVSWARSAAGSYGYFATRTPNGRLRGMRECARTLKRSRKVCGALLDPGRRLVVGASDGGRDLSGILWRRRHGSENTGMAERVKPRSREAVRHFPQGFTRDDSPGEDEWWPRVF